MTDYGKVADIPSERIEWRENIERRREQYTRARTDASGTPRPDLWLSGIQQLRRMRVTTREEHRAAIAAPAPATFAGVSWGGIGPRPVRVDNDQQFQGVSPGAGEVNDIAIDPRGNSDQTIYISTNAGGVWKTVDGGATWVPLTDHMESLSMGAVALDPTNPDIVYAGTGNEFDGGQLFNKGVGIYRSIDGGATWTQLGKNVLGGAQIVRILVPATDHVLVASSNGVFLSIDGGTSFGANAPTFDDGNPVLAGDVDDMRLDNADPSIVYACVDGQGIFVSSDGGVTFPANQNLFNNQGAPAAGSFDEISLAQSGTTLYALVTDENANPRFNGLYRSSGVSLSLTWTLMPGAAGPAAENNGLQADYDFTVGADPANADRVYIGFQELYLSLDGGLNFGTPAVTHNKVHFDHHSIVFSPHHTGSEPTPMYVGTDGGVSRSDDGGTTWHNLNETIATSLFKGIDIGRNTPANRGFTYGGTQDTGTLGRHPAFAGTDWHLGIDGDGGPVVVDPNDPTRVYGSDDTELIITTDGGAHWNRPLPATTNLPVGPFGGSTGNPLGLDPNNSSVLYASVDSQLFNSVDKGATFAAMHTFPAQITAFASVKHDSKVLMVGCADGSVHRTTNANTGGGSAWTALAVTGALALPVGGIAIDPNDELSAVVVYAGLSNIPPANPSVRTKHVFRTTDGGQTFDDISGTDGGTLDDNLPDIPCHSVVLDTGIAPNGIVVSTDGGVVRSIDNGATWQIYGVGLPSADCLSLAIDNSTNPPLVRVGTYGRGCFELQRLTGPRISVNANLAFGTVAQGSGTSLPIDIFNIGDTDLIITSITDSSGNPSYALVAPPTFPLTVPSGGHVQLNMAFGPTTGGPQITSFSIASNDATAPAVTLPVSGSSPLSGAQVTSVVPTSGPAAGGTAVTVLGSGLAGASAVMFGATAATGLTVSSDILLTCVSPPGGGAVDVTVVTPTGVTPITPNARFTYVGAGTVVSGLNPKEGPETGGTPVIISGSGFTGATQVLFGAFATNSFTVDNDSQITAISPAGTGTVDVLVATPAGTSAVSAADRFRYVVGVGGIAVGGTGGTGGTLTGGAGADPETDVMHALADILRTGTDPEIMEAQRILLRRIALEGNIIDSRVPAPKNITEIGGYVNLLGTLGDIDTRTQMLASILGVAGPATPVGLSGEATPLTFVSIGNDRPDGPIQPTLTTAITVRSDFVDALMAALQRVHGLGCALPLFSPARVLPAAQPGQPAALDFLLLLGRVLQIAPTAVLNDPATDPLALARRDTDAPTALQLVARELDDANRIAPATWLAFQATPAGATLQPPTQREYMPLAPILADAGWYPSQPLALPLSLSQPGSLVRLINIAGLIPGHTLLGDELSLLYSPSAIARSALAALRGYMWNGTTFVPPTGAPKA